MPSFAVIRSPLKSPSSRASTARPTSADSAESISTELVPYSRSTANRIQIRPAESTAVRVVSSRAVMMFDQTSSGFPGNRSATAPRAGPKSTGIQTVNRASAARLSEPVSDLTQIPAAGDIAELPNPETTTAARNSPAVRSLSTRPAADPAIVPTEPP